MEQLAKARIVGKYNDVKPRDVLVKDANSLNALLKDLKDLNK